MFEGWSRENHGARFGDGNGDRYKSVTRPVLVFLPTHMSQPATSSTSSPTTMSVPLQTESPPSVHEPPSHLDNVSQENSDVVASGESLSSPRPLRIYTRPQLLSLSQSPMVKPPPDMPDLRTWFG